MDKEILNELYKIIYSRTLFPEEKTDLIKKINELINILLEPIEVDVIRKTFRGVNETIGTINIRDTERIGKLRKIQQKLQLDTRLSQSTILDKLQSVILGSDDLEIRSGIFSEYASIPVPDNPLTPITTEDIKEAITDIYQLQIYTFGIIIANEGIYTITPNTSIETGTQLLKLLKKPIVGITGLITEVKEQFSNNINFEEVDYYIREVQELFGYTFVDTINNELDLPVTIDYTPWDRIIVLKDFYNTDRLISVRVKSEYQTELLN